MEEVDYNEVELSHLVLTVDIWDLQADREMNLVRQSNASPCISSAATGAYPIATTGPPATHTAPEVFSDDALRYSHQRNMPVTNQGGSAYQAPSSTPNYQARQTYVNGQVNGQNSYAPPPPPPAPYQNGSSPYVVAPYQQYPDSRYQSQPAPPAALPRPSYGNQLPPIGAVVTGSVPPQPNPIPTAMEQTYVHTPPTNTQLYTRNLIGSLCASAFRLKDENDKVGIWFVLQDLSVRTEGWFRLKANFFNISDAVQKQMADASNGTPPNKAKVTAPCLANVFTSPFRVYSAKKFPGVVESTLLSKAFANQGIKIPIRKDTGSKRHREDSDDEGSGGED